MESDHFLEAGVDDSLTVFPGHLEEADATGAVAGFGEEGQNGPLELSSDGAVLEHVLDEGGVGEPWSRIRVVAFGRFGGKSEPFFDAFCFHAGMRMAR